MEKITWSQKKLDNLLHDKNMLLTTKRYYVSFVLLILFLSMAGYSSAQPFLLSKKVSLQIKDQSLQSAIDILSKQTGARFSYDPDMFAANQKISLNITLKPLSEVLQLLFSSPAVQFKEIGNQIVIFKKMDMPAFIAPPEIGKTSRTDDVSRTVEDKPSQWPDTVYVSRTDTLMVIKTDTLTVYKTETIILHDTVVKTDTVYLYKTQKPGKSLFPDFEKNSVKNRKFKEQNGWYGGVSYEHLFGSPKLKSEPAFKVLQEKMSASSTSSPLNFSFQGFFGYDYYKIGIQSGMSYTRLGENFEYSFTEQVGGYYKTDTVEQYYTVSGIDTSWFYITDSSYVGIDYKKFSYKNPNAYRYIEIPISLKFRIIQGENFNFFVSGGIIGGLLVGQKALIVASSETYPIEWTGNSRLKPLVWSWKAGFGADYSFAGGWSLFAEVNYRNHLGSVYNDYPLEKKFGLFNLKTGIFVRL